MHQRTLLTQRETRSNTQRQPDRLCEERPAAEVPVYDEPGEDGFDFWYAAACCLFHSVSIQVWAHIYGVLYEGKMNIRNKGPSASAVRPE